jgi:hypothetical protein
LATEIKTPGGTLTVLDEPLCSWLPFQSVVPEPGAASLSNREGKRADPLPLTSFLTLALEDGLDVCQEVSKEQNPSSWDATQMAASFEFGDSDALTVVD